MAGRSGQQNGAGLYTLGEDGRYGRPEIYATGDRVKVALFPDLVIDLVKVFAG